jgi:hypothetical protein
MEGEMDLFRTFVEIGREQADATLRTDPVREVRQAAIDRAEAGAGSEWMTLALAAVRRVAARGRPFSTNDVWTELGEDAATHEPRAIGAVMRRAAHAGMIQPRICGRCGQHETVDGPERNHGRAMTLWEACRP